MALNPPSKPARLDGASRSGGESKSKSTRFGADITLITTNLPDMNGRTETSRGDKESFVIDGPGEYEIKNVFVKGFLSEGPGGKVNTIYLISFEGISMCFIGALANSSLSSEITEAIEDVDILFVPLGEGGTLDPASAYKLGVSLEASIIIPMYFPKGALEQFIKEGGEGRVESLDKLVVKKKDFEGKAGEIVVLKEE